MKPVNENLNPAAVPENPAPAAQIPSPDPAQPAPAAGDHPYIQAYMQNPYAAPVIKEKRKSKPADLVMAALVFVACFIMTDCFCWTGTAGLGFCVGALLMMGAAVWYIRPILLKKSPYLYALITSYAAGCLSLVFCADHLSKWLTVISLLTLYTCVLMEGTELRAWAAGTFRSIADFCYVLFERSFLYLSEGFYALFHREKNTASTKATKFGKALLGLLIALPLAVVLAILLVSADEAFSGMIGQIELGSLPERIASLILAAVWFIFAFSQLFSLRDAERTELKPGGKGLDPLTVTFFLIGVCVVYVAYLFSQLSYFFNGFLGFLPKGYTVAQYARQGFFELSAVAVINFVIVVLITAFTLRKDEKLPLAVKLAALFLCIFSLALTATEIAKLALYMNSFGLTRLRVLTTVFTVFLAIVFLALIVHIFRLTFPYLKVAVIAGIVIVLAMNLVSVDRTVAEYNVWAYQNGMLNSMDVETVSKLGDAAVPALLKLSEGNNKVIRQKAQNELYDRWKEINIDQKGDTQTPQIDLRAFNTVSYEARRILIEEKANYSPYQ